jgi:hypothetical protein
LNSFRKFDPYTLYFGSETPATVATVATDYGTRGRTVATVATVAAQGTAERNRLHSVVASPAEMPAEWTAGLATLKRIPCPVAVDLDRWRQLQVDANCIIDRWSVQTTALGWSTLDVFGCDPEHPADREDRAGLAWMIRGASIQVITQEVAILRCFGGLLQAVPKCRFTQRRILAWDLATTASGGGLVK